MNRLYDNEGLVACTIIRLLEYGDYDFARIAILVSLFVNDKMRHALNRSNGRNTGLNDVTMCCNAIMINRIYNEMLSVEINSIIILCQMGIIRLSAKGILSLNTNGAEFTSNLRTMNSRRFAKIDKSIKKNISVLSDISTSDLYINLGIQI